MQIDKEPMAVAQPFMMMTVPMGFRALPALVGMPMMGIVHVTVGMLHGFMDVLQFFRCFWPPDPDGGKGCRKRDDRQHAKCGRQSRQPA